MLGQESTEKLGIIGEAGMFDAKQAADKRLRKRTLAFKDYYYYLPIYRKSLSGNRIQRIRIENEFKVSELAEVKSEPKQENDIIGAVGNTETLDRSHDSDTFLGKRTELQLEVANTGAQDQIEPTPEEGISNHQLESLEADCLLGTDVSELLSQVPHLAKVRRQLKEEAEQSLIKSQEYYREYRMQTEVWKKYMVKKNPIDVTFKVHNMSVLCTKVVQNIPKSSGFTTQNMPAVRRDLTALQQCGHDEMDKEVARDRLVDSGWSIEELVEFGIENIKVPKKDNDLFVKMITNYYKDKTLGEVIDLHELIKSPFHLNRSRREYKLLLNPEEQKKYIKEQETSIFEFLVKLVYSQLEDQNRVSFALPPKRVRILLKELKQMLAR